MFETFFLSLLNEIFAFAAMVLISILGMIVLYFIMHSLFKKWTIDFFDKNLDAFFWIFIVLIPFFSSIASQWFFNSKSTIAIIGLADIVMLYLYYKSTSREKRKKALQTKR